MQVQRFEVPVPGEVAGGVLVGEVVGDGPPVLLLHGGPALSFGVLDPLRDELVDGHRVAGYQQRGLLPSTAGTPYDVTAQAHDVARVLDALGWDRAVVVGHSWGGHLLLHVLAEHPDRLVGAVVVDPLGGVGDGGEAEFDAEMERRTPEESRERAAELDRRALAGEGTEADALESLRLFWPAYFADPASAPPMPPTSLGVEAYATTFDSLRAALPHLAGRIAGATVPTVFVHGGASPMPVTASTLTAQAIGDAARVVVLEGAGHFPWYEHPGAVRRVVDELGG